MRRFKLYKHLYICYPFACKLRFGSLPER